MAVLRHRTHLRFFPQSMCYLTDNSELFVHRMGSVPFLIQTMQKYPNDASIMEVACDIFFEMGHNKRLRKPILAAKAASALATAYETFPHRLHVQEAARDALNILTSV